MSNTAVKYSFFSRLYHEIKVLLGYEQKCFNGRAVPPSILYMDSNGKVVKNKETDSGWWVSYEPSEARKAKKSAKTRELARVRSQERTVTVKGRVSVSRVARLSILVPVILLALREFLPGIEEHLKYTYLFLDQVIIPIIEWFYRIVLKAYNHLMAEGWFKNAIDALNNLSL